MREEAFERLYANHAERIFAFLAYRTGDRALSEDLAAEVFERAYRARFRFDPRRGTEATWLYGIALNGLRDERRRREREQRALARIDVAETQAPHDGRVADRDQISRALVVLSEEEREAVALRFGADLTVPQIARLLGEPHTTVEGRVYRALRKLRGELVDGEAAAGPTVAQKL